MLTSLMRSSCLPVCSLQAPLGQASSAGILQRRHCNFLRVHLSNYTVTPLEKGPFYHSGFPGVGIVFGPGEVAQQIFTERKIHEIWVSAPGAWVGEPGTCLLEALETDTSRGGVAREREETQGSPSSLSTDGFRAPISLPGPMEHLPSRTQGSRAFGSLLGPRDPRL